MVVHRLVEERRAKPNHEPVAFFYCNRNEPDRRDPAKILSAIVKQLAVPKLGLPKPVIMKYEKREAESSTRPLQLIESRDLIQELISIHPKTTIVIDALDETDPNTRRELLNALEFVVESSNGLLKIFVSSRDDNDIIRKLEKVPNLYIQASDNEQDIKCFVHREVARVIDEGILLEGQVSCELRQRIESTLVNEARGMYIHPPFHC